MRSATACDVEAVLDLLTDYGQPRSDFEPWYYCDPTYRPWQSFVLEHHGQLLCHARLFVRTMRLNGAMLSIAGVGNVITAIGARGHGHAHRVLAAALQAAENTGYAYSFLWTHLPALYAAHGFSTVEETRYRVRLDASGHEAGIRPAETGDVPGLLAADRRCNARRTGPIRMDQSLWCATHYGNRARTLVSQQTPGRADNLSYLRYRMQGTGIEVLDLGVEPQNLDIARGLLGAAAAVHTDISLDLTLPASLARVLDPWQPQTYRVAELMGKPLSLNTLAAVLSWLLPPRLRATGRDRARLRIGTPATDALLHITGDGVTLSRDPTPPAHGISTAALTRFLLHGADTPALVAEGHSDHGLLAALFPVQDFVIWPGGRF